MVCIEPIQSKWRQINDNQKEAQHYKYLPLFNQNINLSTTPRCIYACNFFDSLLLTQITFDRSSKWTHCASCLLIYSYALGLLVPAYQRNFAIISYTRDMIEDVTLHMCDLGKYNSVIQTNCIDKLKLFRLFFYPMG